MDDSYKNRKPCKKMPEIYQWWRSDVSCAGVNQFFYEYLFNRGILEICDSIKSNIMATIQVTYYLWVDATGFVITGKPEPNATDDRKGSFFLVVERNPNKEYTDGFSNFFCYNACNYMNGTATVDHYMTPYIRPFTYQNRDYNQEGMPTINVSGIYFPACPWTSFKSVGNGKVYYNKIRISPCYRNTINKCSFI